MNHQEFFNITAIHLLTQNEKASNTDGDHCMYLTPGGLRCAIGCHIPADKYDPIIEDVAVSLALSGDSVLDTNGSKQLRSIFKSIGIDDGFCALAVELQRVHDCSPTSDWRTELQQCAKGFFLTMPAVTGKLSDKTPH